MPEPIITPPAQEPTIIVDADDGIDTSAPNPFLQDGPPSPGESTPPSPGESTPPSPGDPPSGLESPEDAKVGRPTLRATIKRLEKEKSDLASQMEALRTQVPAAEALEGWRAHEAEAKRLKAEMENLTKFQASWAMPGDYAPEQDEDLQAIHLQAGEILETTKLKLGSKRNLFTAAKAIELARKINSPDHADEAYAEIEESFGQYAPSVIDSIVSLRKLGEKAQETQASNSSQWAAKRVQAHSRLEAQAREFVSKIGAASAAEMTSDPEGPNSLVTEAAKEDPEYAKFVDGLRQRALLETVGPAPFDPNNISPYWAQYAKNGQLDENGIALAAKAAQERQKRIINAPAQLALYEALLPLHISTRKEKKILVSRLAAEVAQEPKIDPDLSQKQDGEIDPFGKNPFLS